MTAVYKLLDLGIDPARVTKCLGTHAHELSMVIGAVLGSLDDKAGVPITQVIGHMLYFFKSRPLGKTPILMPMLPDTLGTRAFMRVAKRLKVPCGDRKGDPVLSVIGMARQDSGGLQSFKDIMAEFGFAGALMASEIETPDDLISARDIGYIAYGAGGFMGDSEKAWDSSKENISMAVKVMRVYVNGERCPYSPVKTGEIGEQKQIKEGKLELDGLLSAEEVAKAKERSTSLATSDPRLSDADLQQLFDDALGPLLLAPTTIENITDGGYSK